MHIQTEINIIGLLCGSDISLNFWREGRNIAVDERLAVICVIASAILRRRRRIMLARGRRSIPNVAARIGRPGSRTIVRARYQNSEAMRWGFSIKTMLKYGRQQIF